MSARLTGLALTGPGVDRDAEARTDPGLLGRLLTLPATRVLAIRDGRLPVTHADGGTGLAFRAPSPADLDAFAIYLGRAAPGPGVGPNAARSPRRCMTRASRRRD